MRPFARRAAPSLPFLAAGAVTLLLWAAGALEPLERPLYDLRVSARFLAGSPSGTASRLAVVAVDEPSLEALGRWPWPAERHARLVETLAAAGAAAVGLDLILAEPTGERGDEALARAVAQSAASMPVFLPAGPEAPHASLAQAATGLGSIRFPLDPDGAVRRLPLPATGRGTEPLSVLLARVGGLQEAGGPTTLWLDLRRPPVLRSPLRPEDLFPTFSYVAVLDGRVPPEALRGRIVLVGATAPGLGDRHLTALRRLGPVPGVFLHANAVRALLDPEPIRRVPGASLAIFLVVLAIAASVLRTGHSAALFFPLQALVIYGVTAVAAFARAGVWLELAPAAAALGGGQLVVGLEAYMRERHRRARVEATFGRYVSPAVLRELLRPGAAAGPGGRRLEVTVLVTDLCRFTRFAEDRPPEEAVEALNAYLEAMARPVLEAGGMVDKYVGDGLLALFGAPLPDPGHARAALAVAEEIRRSLLALNEARGLAGAPVLQARIALHSGEVIAGSVGTAERLDYTAVGDPVNLCARLEKAAAPGEVVATRAVFDRAGFTPGPPWEGPERLPIRGRDEPAEVYRLPAEPRAGVLQEVSNPTDP
ncbi:CHASE2 domain-containing protein [Limnochorda pilosa]|uniref:Guanylate cyclase domain-containing protein n=1 Tax=Limnochorda pilosa TaxID=1555112 RepID=A0A0K2SJD6_LIMPI|nr:adenylate/guanylate cyclase domain-containing protein [Limnochorda pilosa]BAS26964.1 hypothetical protein LIP_1107 [Limnochorda pilosa]